MKLVFNKFFPFYVLPLLILLSLANCAEKEKKPEDLGFISLGEAKDYLLFKRGTWWVYRNSTTKELDSMLLISCSLDTLYSQSDKRYFHYENIGYYIESSRDGASYHTYSYGLNADSYQFKINWNWFCGKTGGYNPDNIPSYPGSFCHFYYPFEKRDDYYSSSFLERINSMLVYGTTYNDIVSFKVPKDNACPYPKDWTTENSNCVYYWAKNIGLIKIEWTGWTYSNGNSVEVKMNWELVESHIIK